MNTKRFRFTPRKAFSLVEVTIALGIASFCLISIVGMLPVGLAINRASVGNTFASSVVSSVLNELRYHPSPTTGNFMFDPGSTAIQTQFLSKDGSPLGNTWNNSADYRVSLQLTPPPAGERRATLIRIVVSWPAAADPTASQWPTRAQGTFETIAAVDQN